MIGKEINVDFQENTLWLPFILHIFNVSMATKSGELWGFGFGLALFGLSLEMYGLDSNVGLFLEHWSSYGCMPLLQPLTQISVTFKPRVPESESKAI